MAYLIYFVDKLIKWTQGRQITAGRILHVKNCKFTAIMKASACQTNRQKVQKGSFDGFVGYISFPQVAAGRNWAGSGRSAFMRGSMNSCGLGQSERMAVTANKPVI
jgi:hypothetical protein